MEMNDARASCISHLIEKRMKTTGDIVLAQLAYVSHEKVSVNIQLSCDPLARISWLGRSPIRSLWEVYRQLNDKMVQLSANYGVPNAFVDIGPMFYTFLMNYEWTNEPLVIQMQRLANTTIMLSHREVSWRAFTEVAVKLSLLLATESTAERVISILGSHFSNKRSSLKDDLFSAEARIVVQKKLDEYNAKVDLGRSPEA